MNELIKTVESDNGELLISGRELHEFLDVKTNYRDWIKRMISYGFVENSDFLAIAQKRATAQGNQTSFTDHQLKIDMAKQIAMLQRTKKGKEAREYFLAVEHAWNDPRQVIERGYRLAIKETDKLKERIETEYKPKAIFADAVAHSHGTILVRDLAKLLNQNGYETGEKRLYAQLVADGYLIKRHGVYTPMQTYSNQGLFRLAERTISNATGDTRTAFTLYVTGKGQTKLLQRYLGTKELALQA